jgi:hypothetical protein
MAFMNVKELIETLSSNDLALTGVFPSGETLPAHFHVTEVGKVTKQFIDCGGTMRDVTTCVLQIWVADDVSHRLKSGKLSKVLELAQSSLDLVDDLEVEIEYETETVSLYPLTSVDFSMLGFCLNVGRKHTACLAPDKCGVC